MHAIAAKHPSASESSETEDNKPTAPISQPDSLLAEEISGEEKGKDMIGWHRSVLIVLSSHFVVMNTSGFTNSFGALQSYFIDTFNEPSSTVSWIGSMQIFLYFFIGIFSGRLMDAGYFRVTFLTGSLSSIIGILASSFGSQLWIMFLTLGLGVGLGNGLMSCPMLAVISQHFTARRGLALGITMCGSCTGGLIYPVLMRQLIPTLGFPWTMRIIALIQLVTLAMANICLKPKTKGQKTSGLVDWSAFQDVRFNHYAMATFLSLLGLYISIFFVVDYSRTSVSPPFSYKDSLNLLLVFNGVNIIGRFGSGFIADKIGVLTLFIPIVVATSVTLVAWIPVKTAVTMYVWTVFCGIFSGGIQSLFPAGLGYLTAGTEKPGTRMVSLPLIIAESIPSSPQRNSMDGHSEDLGNPQDTFFFLGSTDFDQALDHALTNPGFSEIGYVTPRDQDNSNFDPQTLYPALLKEPLEAGTDDLLNPLEVSGPFAPVTNALSEPQDGASTPSKPGRRLSLASVRILNKWLASHTHHPYPNVRDVEAIERQSGLSRQQILNWFANARRRKKFKQPETTDNSSAEASPRDIPLRRPPTPMFQQSPLERWQNSPPEDEPFRMADIARAVSGAGQAVEPNYTRLSHGRAPSSTGTLATTDTSDSSSSAYSYNSNESLRRVAKKRRRAGRRNHGTRGLLQVVHRFQCTFCTETFKLKHTWQRHERTQHLSLEQWECSPFGPTVINEQSGKVCVYCGLTNPDNTHLESHNHDLCHKRERGERVFYRNDHLRQHLRLVHGSEFLKWPMEQWKSKNEAVLSRCGFCDMNMATWSERVNHLAEHFKDGRTMADWKGNWGFDDATLEMVENSMPPYLIDYERNSPLPFSTQQGAPYSSTSAFELLHLELVYFYSNYVDAHQCVPSDETLHKEACCVIFGAELSYQHPPTASSWLRDLLMGTEHIVALAKITPMKSAARSRFSELKIHSKKDIFEDCKLEASLRQHVGILQLVNLSIGDDELQQEACSIINHMPGASPMFTNLLIKLVYASTHWLAGFRARMGLPSSEDLQQESMNSTGFGESGMMNRFLTLNETNEPHLALEGSLSPSPIAQGHKIVSLNDGNMYRGLTRDLTRYVARTISPLNPTSHVPTDEELQYQARWIMYDSHDVWNQTPADNADWLAEFKRESGFF
ncbi:hypothetical protein F53441_1100 [Fusarium austroafricanum]|uniref:Monocarboxylate transporter 4 n=1 Tax=Fusarium austroafricanum TaxID=2364996 RepID=A0A8H4KWE2_9HYPO|nr:hypothetical protein F53441_1100 [Fusarium austroafricanum]